jgi:hypothetical protein
MSGEDDDDFPHGDIPDVGGRAWPDPGEPPDGSTAHVQSRYTTVGILVDALRKYAAEYYSSNRDYRDGYRAGMRKSAQLLVNWLHGKGFWDR